MGERYMNIHNILQNNVMKNGRGANRIYIYMNMGYNTHSGETNKENFVWCGG